MLLPPPTAPSVTLAGQAQAQLEPRVTSNVFALLRSEVECFVRAQLVRVEEHRARVPRPRSTMQQLHGHRNRRVTDLEPSGFE
jgi:hypothetical protein